MSAPRLTESEIQSLLCPAGSRDRVISIGPPTGFYVRITAAGTKTYLLQYRAAGTTRRLTLGKVGEVRLADARKAAEVARGQVSLNRDPWAERKAAAATATAERAERRAARQADALTLERLVQQWREIGLRGRSEAHRKDAPAALARCLPAEWTKPVNTLTTAALQKRIDAIGRTNPPQAERVKAYGRACLNWAAKRGLTPAGFNPFLAVAIETRATARERVLSDAELGAAWLAAGAMPYPFGPLFRLMILTLQRKGEVAGMAWPELAEDFAEWRLPGKRTKNRRMHIVHLAQPARAILGAIPMPVGSDLVFTTTGKTVVSGFSGAAARLREGVLDLLGHDDAVAMEAEPWRLHDFRRTGVTVMARRGVAPHVADKVLNHAEGAIRTVAAIYQRHDFLKERAAALDLWAEHVLAVAADVRRQAQARAADDERDAGRRAAGGGGARRKTLPPDR